MHMLRLTAAVITVLFVAACATVPPSQQEDLVGEVLRFLEESRADELIQHSVTPFLLDAEIIESGSDIADLWRLLTDRGYRFPEPKIVSITPVDDHSYQLFGDSMEARVFFDRYLPEDSAVAEVAVGSERFRFIFAEQIGGRNSLPLMYGWRGPL